MKKALITGITGQDGSYLAELLLEKGYEVYGIIRRSSSFNTGRIDHIYQDVHEADARLKLIYGDLLDGHSIRRVIQEVRPDEIYNLGAQSHVRVSFDIPEYTGNVDALGFLRILEILRELRFPAKVYQASSSEVFGEVLEVPQSEKTPFNPRSPYGAAKAYAHRIAVNYRLAYGMFVSNGILFNHESPRRGETFVSKKITHAAARIKMGLQEKLYLGNLNARRDWGYAPEYVEAMWRMMQQEEPDDFVIATGRTHSVEEFVEKAFSYVGLEWRDYVFIDERYYRPTEVDELCGDASKARQQLGWEPRVSFEELVGIMMEAELTKTKGVLEPVCTI